MVITLSDEKTNLSRQKEFDFAKAIAIVFMVIIHVYEEMCDIDAVLCDYPHGALDNILQFISGPLAAPVFMFAMGTGMIYSKHRTPKEFAKRGLHLFITSYVLNIARSAFLMLFLDRHNTEEIIYEIFNIDILQFAGLAFLLVALLKKLNIPVVGMGGIAIIMQVIGNLLSAHIDVTQSNLQYFLGLFFYTSEVSCFPLLLWFIFPVFGVIFAAYLQHVKEIEKFYQHLTFFGVAGLIGLCFALNFYGFNLKNFYALYEDMYYQQNALSFIFCLFVIATELSLFHYIKKVIHIEKLEKALLYLSKNLNTIYIIQWLIIGNISTILYAPAVDYLFDKTYSVPIGIGIFIISVLIFMLYSKIKTSRMAKKSEAKA